MLRWLWSELDTTWVRQGHLGKDHVGGRSDYRPLPWVEQAADAGHKLHELVHRLTTRLADYASGPPVNECPRHPYGPTAAAIEWLLENLAAFTRTAHAGTYLDQIHRVLAAGLKAVDHPDETVFVGKCGHIVKTGRTQARVCQIELFADPKEETVKCWGCHAEHSLSERREDMMRRARDYVSHSGKLASLITLMGIPIAGSTIRTYASRRGLQTISTDRMGRPQYRVRDVLTLRMGEDFLSRLDRSA